MNKDRGWSTKGGVMFLSTHEDKDIITPQSGMIEEFWHEAVEYGEAHANVTLPVMIEEYLTKTLMQYIREVFFMDTPIAIHFLEGLKENDLVRLAQGASASLLILGPFPERTKRMLVSPSYLLYAGRSSYDHLALRFETIHLTHDAALARKARDSFEPMARVLRGMRMKENIFTLPILDD